MTQSIPVWFMLVSSAALGAVLGSFLNVCIYRIPRRLSLIFPPSTCPDCDERIAPYDNVPILGWLMLRGRCRRCRNLISPRYPIVEALTAGVFLFLVWHYGLSWEYLSAMYFAAVMIVVTLIDFDAYIIPDVITLSGVPLGLLATALTPITFWESLAGAALGFLFLYGVAWAYERTAGVEGMGGGDIKFAAMLGAFLGWKGVLMTVFGAAALGAVVGLVILWIRRGDRRTMLPFGTFLAPVGFLIYVWGEPWLRAYVEWAHGLGG